MNRVYINGKFTAQAITGVQRVAHNLLQALDARLADGSVALPGPATLLIPPGGRAPSLRCIDVQRLGDRNRPLHLWEQALLPWAARDGLLLNLSGSAPLLARRQVCMLHDAAVFDRPQAYTAAFARWYRTLFWLLPRRRARLLTVSAFSQGRLAARLGIAAARVGIVPNGADHLQAVVPDPAALSRHGLAPGRYLLAVGSASLNKNLDALQAAFAALPAGRGVRLAIVGGSARRVFAGGPATAAQPVPGVVHTGPVDDASLKALYQHAAALVFPSLYEGFGLPPLEAMACGCPVAASNAAAIPEVCGDAALYFDPTSIAQMTAAMQRLLDDEALCGQLRRAGTQRVRAFAWAASAEALAAQLHSEWTAGGAQP